MNGYAKSLSRRDFLGRSVLAASAGGLVMPGLTHLKGCTAMAGTSIKPDLDKVARSHFQYFRAAADAQTGLTCDRWPSKSYCSIAAVGFSLTAYGVACTRNWITRTEAVEYTRKTLRTLWQAPQGDAASGTSGRDGFFYHFLDLKTATRAGGCEVSTIDTALLMAGVRFAGCYFDGACAAEKEIRSLADALYRRVRWSQALLPSGHLSHGWMPEKGLLKPCWTGYCEAAILALLAIGSPTYPVPPSTWQKFMGSAQVVAHYGLPVIEFGPLFGHQYSHCWVDFRGIADSFARTAGFDYFENSRRSALIQQRYAQEDPLGFRGYSELDWGLTACDGPGWTKKLCQGRWRQFHAYAARGFPRDLDDGTIAPTAALASLPFAPEIVLPTLAHWLHKRPELWTPYGFADAFNPTFDPTAPSGWVCSDVLGIDQGPIVLMFENYRSGLVWKVMQKDPYLKAGLVKAGFNGAWLSPGRR